MLQHKNRDEYVFQIHLLQIHLCTGCPKKRTFRMLLGPQCTGLITSSWHPCVWKLTFGRFLLRQSLIKPSQVMFMVKSSPTALDFGYDFVLLGFFLGHPVFIFVKTL